MHTSSTSDPLDIPFYREDGLHARVFDHDRWPCLVVRYPPERQPASGRIDYVLAAPSTIGHGRQPVVLATGRLTLNTMGHGLCELPREIRERLRLPFYLIISACTVDQPMDDRSEERGQLRE